MGGIGILLSGAFLIAHGLIHATFTVPPPPPGPVQWPFSLDQSRLLGHFAMVQDSQRIIGTVLWVTALVTFVFAGLGLWGLPVLTAWWSSLVGVGALASLLLLLCFWHKLLVFGVLIDVILLMVVAWF